MTNQTAGSSAFTAITEGHHRDPFAVLGPHMVGDQRVVTTYQPHARAVELLDESGDVCKAARKVHDGGVFQVSVPARVPRYSLRVTTHGGHCYDTEDPYRFPSTLGEIDMYLLGEGTHRELYRVLGAQLTDNLGVAGVRFGVWAPNASRVSVIGDFNNWDGRRNPMRFHPGSGIWELFMPGLGNGDKYKFELLDHHGNLLPLKTDPVGHYFEPAPGNASIVYRSDYEWSDDDWMARRTVSASLDGPVSIYEVHPGSWRRDENGNWLTWDQLGDELIPYVTDLGFTHIELLPITEHPFDGSWGYQPIGLFAPTQRFGTPDAFRRFIDRCHEADLGVIVDWVPAHFPRDEHGLGRFDGTALYEHADPRKGAHADWGTLIFNFGRREVANYLLSSALYWVDEFHIDGIRVDAVASMHYLDYSREAGEWIPNEFGGNENLEAVAFLKRFNEVVHEHGAVTFAEESTAWPGVSRPVYIGGLGFTYKWNMGWMNDTLRYMSEDPLNRKYHHDKMTFGLVYAFDENFVLPLSHDEVVHGKRSLIGRMPGDLWQQFANLRAYYATMFCHPGKKLLFMGAELAQWNEWSHERSLDWNLLDYPAHNGIRQLVGDLNALYRSHPALYEVDFESSGFEWINWEDRDASVLSWVRYARDGSFLVVVANFTPVVREHYQLGVPRAGAYRERLNTDAETYGGSNVGNLGEVSATHDPVNGRPASLSLTLPPLAALILQPAD